MKTLPLEEALSLTGNNQPLNIYQDSTCSAAWLVISPENPDEANPIEVRTESFAINPHDNASTIEEAPEEFVEKEDAPAIKANAALLAHFYNHGPELVEQLSNAYALLERWPAQELKPGSVMEALVLETRSKVASALIKASTVQLP